MPNMVDAEVLFQAIVARKKRSEDSLRHTYQSIGEATVAGRTVSDYDKASVRDYKGRISELEWLIEEMQKIARAE